ncbi:MAG: efflux RND transporter periplasmic adaptor subunit [Deltaproteobacteria bacterium]|jgi:HlyD family secretion protein|nr:efflux RND transporter periplasmic adaptor subunit [Deltaproteobacteria bacterium]
MSKKLIFIIILVLALGAGLYYFFTRGGDDASNNYRTQRVIIDQLRIAVSATGTLNPVRVVNVGTQISGTISDIYVDFNDTVQAGQVLLKLDDELFAAKVKMSEANLTSAQAQMRLAEIKYERQERLYKAGSSPKEELDTAEANLSIARSAVNQAEASLEQDRYNLNNTTIISPVDGVVTNKAVDVGQTVAASFQTPTLIDIAQDLSEMQINASFAEADVGRLRNNLSATFTVDAFPGLTFNGTLRQIRLNPTITSNVVTYVVVVDVENPDLILLPGMTAYVDIELYKEENVLLIPNTALNFKPPYQAADGEKPPSPNPESPEADVVPNPEDSPGATTAGETPTSSGIESAQSASVSASGLPSPDDPPTRGRVYILGKDFQPVAVDVLLGATDLRYTVVKGGNLKEGDLVIVGENTTSTGSSLFGGGGNARPAGRPF